MIKFSNDFHQCGQQEYSLAPNTRAPLNKRAPLADFGNLIIVPGEIRKMPLEPHLPFLIPLTQFDEFLEKITDLNL